MGAVYLEDVEIELTDNASSESSQPRPARLHNYAQSFGSTSNNKRKHTQQAMKISGRCNNEILTFLVEK